MQHYQCGRPSAAVNDVTEFIRLTPGWLRAAGDHSRTPGWFWAAGHYRARTAHVDRVGGSASPYNRGVIMPHLPTARRALVGGAR